MSVGRRLYDLVRSNLNALIDRQSGERLEDLSDEELEAELERRRARRQAEIEEERAQDAERRREREAQKRREREAERRRETERQRTSEQKRTTGRSRTQSKASTASLSAELRRHYATLETPVGADFETVKRNFRRLMRKHHPDVNAGSPEQLRQATERSQAITQAFAAIERHFLGRA